MVQALCIHNVKAIGLINSRHLFLAQQPRRVKSRTLIAPFLPPETLHCPLHDHTFRLLGNRLEPAPGLLASIIMEEAHPHRMPMLPRTASKRDEDGVVVAIDGQAVAAGAGVVVAGAPSNEGIAFAGKVSALCLCCGRLAWSWGLLTTNRYGRSRRARVELVAAGVPGTFFVRSGT